MENLIQDIRYAFRVLRKNPVFVLVAAFTLALGIGANTTIFSAVYATLFDPFSFSTKERLVMLWERNLDVGIQRGSVSPANYLDWREQNQTLDLTVLQRRTEFDLITGGEPERIPGHLVSADFFTALDVKPLYGRTFAPGEDQAGNGQVVVLRHSLWKRLFAGDPGVINQTVWINNQTYTIIGVMPEDFNFPPGGGDLWAPMVFAAEARTDRGNHYLQVMGLLKPGVTIDQASDDLNAIARRAQQQFPETNSGRSVNVMSLTKDYTRGSRMFAPVIFGSVAFVLLIACANVANLLLVRGASRQKEIAIRLALGASRIRLIRQLLTESLLIAILGGAIGLAFSVWGVAALKGGIPEGFSRFIPGWENMGIHRSALFFTLAISVLTGLLFGIIPALQTTRMNFNDSLKEGGKGGAGKSTRNRARSMLVVSEIALSLVLLIGAGLTMRTFINLQQADFGINPTNVLKFRLSLPQEGYKNPDQKETFFKQFLQRIETLPGVVGADAINTVPMGGSNNSSAAHRIGQTVYEQNQRPIINNRIVTAEYFDTMKMQFVEGRPFTEQDRLGTPQVVVVNEAFAKQFFPGRSPLGEQLSFGGEWTKEIIGVTKNVMSEDMEEYIQPEAFTPYSQIPVTAMDVVVRATSEPTALTTGIRNELAQLNRQIPIFDVKTMDQVITERMSPKRLMAFMLAVVAIIALALASVGIYAVMSYSVSQRTHELGVRMALGAQSADILRLVLGHGFTLTVSGLAIGLLGAFAMTRALAGILYGVQATDLLTFAGLSLLLATIAALACYLPARRATRVDPMIALRYE